jgi:excisionase family DNA binding protein
MKELITEKQLIDLLKLSRATISRLRKNGMPYKKIGKSVRYDYDEVRQWLEKQI